MLDIKKSLVIFTSFWDANVIIENKYVLHHDEAENKIYKINLFANQSNFEVASIALSHPDFSSKGLSNLSKCNVYKINELCPTYDLLQRYKEDKNWEKYRKEYYDLIKSRNMKIKSWIESLEEGRAYILCCWENTSKGAHCHREILYEIFNHFDSIKKKVFSIYRHGEKNIERTRLPQNQTFDYPTYPTYSPLFISDLNSGLISRNFSTVSGSGSTFEILNPELEASPLENNDNLSNAIESLLRGNSTDDNEEY
jgi:hypothetical protein